MARIALVIGACLFYFANSIAGFEDNAGIINALVRPDNELEYSHANFVDHPFHQLDVNPVASSSVRSSLECCFACLRVVTCFSVNVAANPDIEGRTLCELLPTDKYNSSDKFKANPLFHHHSIYTPCRQNPCENGGKCVALYSLGDFKCICSPGFHGKRCDAAVNPASFYLYFTKKTTKDFVVHHGLSVSNAFTVCYRVRTTELTTGRSVFSYATTSTDNEILLITMPGKMRFWLNGQMKDLSFPATEDGSWHHICATWENANGQTKLYRDGALQGSTLGLKKDHVISSAGTLVIGQEQDSLGGGFQAKQCFVGRLTDLNVWDRVLTSAEISKMSSSCHAFAGNVKKWSDFRAGIRGSLKVLSPSACEP